MSRWWKRANHNKSQILYYFGENFDSRSAQFVEKLELLTKKSRTQCELEVRTCSNIIYYYASICDKIIGKMNVRSSTRNPFASGLRKCAPALHAPVLI